MLEAADFAFFVLIPLAVLGFFGFLTFGLPRNRVMSHSNPQINLSIPLPLREQLEHAANQADRSLSFEIVLRLQSSFFKAGFADASEPSPPAFVTGKHRISSHPPQAPPVADDGGETG